MKINHPKSDEMATRKNNYRSLTILNGNKELLFTLDLYERIDSERISCTILGVFDSKHNAEITVEALLKTKGFKNYSKLNFAISPIRVDMLHWDGGFRSSNDNI